MWCWCASMDSNHHCADFKSAAAAGWATRAKMAGARDLNSDDRKGQRSYRPPQLCRICLTPELWRKRSDSNAHGQFITEPAV